MNVLWHTTLLCECPICGPIRIDILRSYFIGKIHGNVTCKNFYITLELSCSKVELNVVKTF
jgi:hypothetical protein